MVDSPSGNTNGGGGTQRTEQGYKMKAVKRTRTINEARALMLFCLVLGLWDQDSISGKQVYILCFFREKIASGNLYNIWEFHRVNLECWRFPGEAQVHCGCCWPPRGLIGSTEACKPLLPLVLPLNSGSQSRKPIECTPTHCANG